MISLGNFVAAGKALAIVELGKGRAESDSEPIEA